MDTILNNGWMELSLVQQMINIGNEVKRAFRFEEGSSKQKMFLDKAIQYTDYTINDPKNKNVIPELNMGKEVLEDYKGSHSLNCSAEQISGYYRTFENLM